MTGEAPPQRMSTTEVRRLAELSRKDARGLTLLSILAVLLSPFSIPTFGIGIALGAILIIVSLVLRRQGYRVRGPLLAGLFAVVVGSASAGACGWFVLRTAEVTGKEEIRQDRVGDRFEEAFENSERAPSADASRDGGPGLPLPGPGLPLQGQSGPGLPSGSRDGGPALDADSGVPGTGASR